MFRRRTQKFKLQVNASMKGVFGKINKNSFSLNASESKPISIINSIDEKFSAINTNVLRNSQPKR